MSVLHNLLCCWGNIIKAETFTIPDNFLDSANVALLLAQKGVKMMLVGKIEAEEVKLLISHGIKVYWNFDGSVKEAIKIYFESDFIEHKWKEKGFNKKSKK